MYKNTNNIEHLVHHTFPAKVVPPVHYEKLNLELIRNEINENGYSIVRGLLEPQTINEIRDFWLDQYAKNNKQTRVTWSPYLGQSNTIGYSKDGFQCLYRSCDFLWNEPLHALTRNVCLRLNAIRNCVLDLPVLKGTIFSEDRYGIFVTTSYYPPGDGFMDAHDDGVSPNIPLVHHIVPLTFKGRDYDTGGMYLINKQGVKVDVDATMNPGDVIFYNGALLHGVEQIRGKLGRMQMFAIPAPFKNRELNESVVREIPLPLYALSKWHSLKNTVAVRLGRKPTLR